MLSLAYLSFCLELVTTTWTIVYHWIIGLNLLPLNYNSLKMEYKPKHLDQKRMNLCDRMSVEGPVSESNKKHFRQGFM